MLIRLCGAHTTGKSRLEILHHGQQVDEHLRIRAQAEHDAERLQQLRVGGVAQLAEVLRVLIHLVQEIRRHLAQPVYFGCTVRVFFAHVVILQVRIERSKVLLRGIAQARANHRAAYFTQQGIARCLRIFAHAVHRHLAVEQ